MPDLLMEVADGVARLTMNRPHRHNAFSAEMLLRLADAWTALAADSTIRVVILTGAGPDAFCAGADLRDWVPVLTGARPASDDWERRAVSDEGLIGRALLRTQELPVPLIAAVNGHTLAGGAELLLAADIRLASSAATFGWPEVTHGVMAAGGSLARLQRQVPYARAAELLLTGASIGASEAEACGLINRVVLPEDLLVEAENVAALIAANGPLAVRKTKEAMMRTSGVPLREAFAIEDECNAPILASDDAREGPLAFAERRCPKFTGR
jgi:enoyl-CoA hydratase